METSGNEANVEAVEFDVFSSQGISGPSEAELRGEDQETTETETTETETTETETEVSETEDPKKEEPEEESKVTEEKTANSGPKTDKVPKGYVPLAAVHEARGEIRYLKEQVESMRTQMSNLQAKPVEKAPDLDDFEVLSDEAFEDLAEDNPAQAAIYLRKLNAYESSKREKAEEERQHVQFVERYEEIIESSVAEIERVAPGIYDENSEVQKEIMEFAESFGFTEDMYYLTNPATKIILPGESEPLLLGDQAASFLSMLVNAKTKMTPQDTSAIETKLREEITAELMKKFKTPAKESFRGLNEVPKSDSEIPESSFKGKVLTTKQLTDLADRDPAAYERYLAGE